MHRRRLNFSGNSEATSLNENEESEAIDRKEPQSSPSKGVAKSFSESSKENTMYPEGVNQVSPAARVPEPKRKRRKCTENKTTLTEESEEDTEEDVEMLREMVRNAVIYLMVLQSKMHPVHLIDIAKKACDTTKRNFETKVLPRVKQSLRDIFGVNVIEVTKPGKRSTNKEIVSSVILVSRYSWDATGRRFGENKADIPRALLAIFLAFIFMKQKAVDEEDLWRIYRTLMEESRCFTKPEEFKKFLRDEYISTLYLKAEKYQVEEVTIATRYSWGLRAEAEFPKFGMLKIISSVSIVTNALKLDPHDWPVQFGIASQETGSEVTVAGGKIVLGHELYLEPEIGGDVTDVEDLKDEDAEEADSDNSLQG